MIYVTTGGREAVAQLITKHIGPEARLLHDPDGAPLLAGSDLHISISHSRHFAALMTDPTRRCGVDIEEARPEQLLKVRSKFLTDRELPLWADDLLTAWTIKEAVYKAAGTPGLALGAIDISRPGVATLPDGRRFALQSVVAPDYTLTSALPMP